MAASPIPDWQEHAFPFENLPKDIRRMIYDYLTEPAYRPLLQGDQGMLLYYETSKLPLSMCLVNKFFHDEVTACLQNPFGTQQIRLLVRYSRESHMQSSMHGVAHLVHLLRLGQLYNKPPDNKNDWLAVDQLDFDEWTLEMPLQIVKGQIRGLQRQWQYPVWQFHDDALRDYYCSSLLKLRRNHACEIHVRCLVEETCDITETRLKFNRRQLQHLKISLAVVMTVVAPGASLVDFFADQGWETLVELPSETEKKLLAKQS